jgi:hypothetical protein
LNAPHKLSEFAAAHESGFGTSATSNDVCFLSLLEKKRTLRLHRTGRH